MMNKHKASKNQRVAFIFVVYLVDALHSSTSSETAWRGSFSRTVAALSITWIGSGGPIAVSLPALSSCAYWSLVGCCGEPIRCQAAKALL